MGRFYEDIRVLGGTVSIGTLTSSNINNVFEVNGNSAVYGSFSTTGLKITNGASSGYILQSDASGNATWVASTSSSANFANTDLTLTNSRQHTIPTNSTLLIAENYFTNGPFLFMGGSFSGDAYTLFGYEQNYMDIDGSAIRFKYNVIDRINIQANETVINEQGGNYDFRIEGDQTDYLFFVDASTDNIGINNNTPNYKLEVSGTVSTTAFRMTNGASNGYILQSDASGNATWVLPTDNTGVTGSGTTNYIPRWTTTDTLSSTSSIYDNGTNVGIGTNTVFSGIKATINTNSSSGYLGLNVDANSYVGTFNYGIISNAQSSSATSNIGVESRTSNGISNDIGFKGQLNGTTVNKTGLELLISGNGLSSNNYGVFANISGANGFNYGNFISISGTYSNNNYGSYTSMSLGKNFTYGSYINISGADTGSYIGSYVNISANSGTSSQYNYGSQVKNFGNGLFNTGLLAQSHNGTLGNFGIWTIIGTTTPFTVGDIGIYSYIGANAKLTTYPSLGGLFTNNSSTTNINYGIQIDCSGTYSSSNIGLLVSSNGSTGDNKAIVTTNGHTIFNENGLDYDFRIEGLTESNLFFVDASTDNIGIGTGTPNPKALIDMTSTTQGFLPPRMTVSQRESISSPPAGLLIFNTDNSRHEGYTGTTWSAFY